MKKQSLYLLALLTMLNTACSTTKVKEEATPKLVEETKSSLLKPVKKMMNHSLPEGVISLDIVNDNNRLHLLTGKHTQGQKTLWYQYSDDGGETWSTAGQILSDDLPAKIGRGNDAQIVVQGKNIVVTWTRFDKNTRFNAGAMLAAKSEDGGQTWQYVETPPDWKKGPHAYIDMAADEKAMHAVWLDSRAGRSKMNATQALHYARSDDGGKSWKANVTLDSLTCSCCWNTIKTNDRGDAYVLYRDKQPSDLSIGVINSQGQWRYLNHVGAFNWQFEGCPHIGGGLDFQTVDNKERIHAVVGTGHAEHAGIHYLYSDDGGKNWSASRQLGNGSALHADVAAHNNGRVMAVWDMMTEDGLAIFAAGSNDQGKTWTTSRQLSMSGMRATHPRIVKTKTGFLALWTESDGHQQTLASILL